MKVSPCLSCTRVKNPGECENKACRVWRNWFVGEWNALRLQPRLAMEKVTMEPEGVVIGGQHYALPHRVLGYLGTDPCQGCRCPRELCVLPCKVKRRWNQVRKDLQV